VWRSADNLRILISVIVTMGISLILVAQAVSTAQYVSLMTDPGRLSTIYSTDVSKDAAFLNANGGGVNAVVTAGWGPGTPLFSLACPADRAKYRDDAWEQLVGLTPSTAPATLRHYFGDRRILLVSLSNAPRINPSDGLDASLWTLVLAYVSAFPGRHPQVVLTTSAYDITYFGPGPFERGHSDC
jgi:hypothetical protein